MKAPLLFGQKNAFPLALIASVCKRDARFYTECRFSCACFERHGSLDALLSSSWGWKKAPRGELDPYEKLEADLDRHLTEIEVVLELLVVRVETQLKNTPTAVPTFEARLIDKNRFSPCMWRTVSFDMSRIILPVVTLASCFACTVCSESPMRTLSTTKLCFKEDKVVEGVEPCFLRAP